MASTVDTGSYALFMYSSQFNATQVDLIFAGKVPTTSSAGVGSWSRLFTSADASASINVAGTVLDLKTQEEGILGTVLTESDKWTVKSGVADVTLKTFKKLLMLAPTYSDSTGVGMPLNANLIGTNLMDYGYPILVVHKSYQNGSTETSIDIPVKSDPVSFVFCKAGLGERAATINYDPKSQQIFDFSLTTVNCTGVTNSNVLGWTGVITASSSS